MREQVHRALQVCPVEAAVSVVGGTWKLSIIKHLHDGPLRFGALRRVTGPVSDRTLTRQLRDLETDGVVHRSVFAEVPPRVEYRLTEFGHTLRPVVEAMNAWGNTIAEEYPHLE